MFPIHQIKHRGDRGRGASHRQGISQNIQDQSFRRAPSFLKHCFVSHSFLTDYSCLQLHIWEGSRNIT